MALVEIDVVGAESIQAGMAAIDDAVNGFQSDWIPDSSAPIANLSGNQDFVTLVL